MVSYSCLNAHPALCSLAILRTIGSSHPFTRIITMTLDYCPILVLILPTNVTVIVIFANAGVLGSTILLVRASWKSPITNCPIGLLGK